MSIEDWGSSWGPMPWGGATNCEGWGGRWGSMPWGGKCTEVPSVPPTGTAGWGRFERVTRERREEREHREIRSVLFKVSGLRARGQLGEVSILGGYGRAVQLRSFRLRSRGALGLVKIEAGTEARGTTEPGVSRLGEVEVLLTLEVSAEIERSHGRIGKPTVKAQRNLTDDELIHMIAEML